MQKLQLTKKYEAYTEYKDSGVDWIEGVPAEWEVLRGKFIFQNKKDVNKGLKNTNVLSLTMNGVINRDSSSNEGLLPMDYQTFQLFQKNDLVFKLIDLENYKTSRVGIVHEDGIMSPVYIRLTTRKHHQNFFYYLYYKFYLEGIYNFLGSGVRSALGPHDLLELEIVVPEKNDQQKIANYLDEKTALIDQIIEKKQKLIELLKEKRTAVINEAVTKGLDPNAELVDSGIDWIGKIPKGWAVERIKDVTQYCSRGATPDYVEDENAYKFINQACVREGFINFDNIKYSSSGAKKGLIENNDLLINSTGTGTLGRIAHFNEGDRYFADTHVTILRFRDMHPRFAMYNLQDSAWQNYLYASSVSGSTNQIELSRGRFLEIPIIIAPLDVQNEIVARLDKYSDLVSRTVDKVGKSIELLKEFKSSLISHVVTGKVKV